MHGLRLRFAIITAVVIIILVSCNSCVRLLLGLGVVLLLFGGVAVDGVCKSCRFVGRLCSILLLLLLPSGRQLVGALTGHTLVTLLALKLLLHGVVELLLLLLVWLVC